jgi:hypothetical protein
MKIDRQTVDLSAFPDLVVIYLGMRVNTLTGLKTLMGFGPKITRSVAERPDGLLLHENLVYSLLPPHRGGFEAVYDNIPEPTGFLRFATVRPAKGRMFTARERLRREGNPLLSPVFTEAELYNEPTDSSKQDNSAFPKPQP